MLELCEYSEVDSAKHANLLPFVESPQFIDLMAGMYDNGLGNIDVPVSKCAALSLVLQDYFGIKLSEFSEVPVFLEKEVCHFFICILIVGYLFLIEGYAS